MVDAHVSGACVERRAGSSPVLGTRLGKVNSIDCVDALVKGHHSFGALDEWLSQRSAKPSTAVRIRQAPLNLSLNLRFFLSLQVTRIK